MREEQGSPTEKLTLLKGGGTGEGRGAERGGPGGGRPKEGAKKAKGRGQGRKWNCPTGSPNPLEKAKASLWDLVGAKPEFTGGFGGSMGRGQRG